MIAERVAAHRANSRMVEGHTPAKSGGGVAVRRKPDATRPRWSRGDAGDYIPAVRHRRRDMPTARQRHRRSRHANRPQLHAIEARRRELEELPPIDAPHALRVVLAAHALVIWWMFAVGHDDGARQGRFAWRPRGRRRGRRWSARASRAPQARSWAASTDDGPASWDEAAACPLTAGCVPRSLRRELRR